MTGTLCTVAQRQRENPVVDGPASKDLPVPPLAACAGGSIVFGDMVVLA